jgi:predicted SprT family Zn-dependent metalloprotease
MDTIEISAPTVQQHNAQMPREAEIVREVDRILRLRLFPSDRVWVDVRFDYGMAEHSSSKVSLMQINGEVHGTAEIRFQGLFLWQDFPTFFNEVVPHELAHVLLEVRCAERGTSVEKGHGDEWLELVLDINPDAEPAAKVKGDFDDRPIKLQKGGIPCECDCCELAAFVVVANTPSTVMKLKSEDLSCSECHSAYRRIQKEQWHDEIVSALKFYESVMAIKVHNAPLSR